MLTENFSSIELGDAAAYAPYFRALPLHAADYTFTNLWGWGTHYNLEWRTAHGLCWIRQKRNDLPVERLWAPVGDWYAADWAAMPELVPGTTILRAPEPLCELLLERLPGRVAIEETPGQWEYLYTQEALSTLAGNKLHKKKNHVNGYMKAYGEDYRTLNGEIMPQVLALQDDWCKWRECGYLQICGNGRPLRRTQPNRTRSSHPLYRHRRCRQYLRHQARLPSVFLFVRRDKKQALRPLYRPFRRR